MVNKLYTYGDFSGNRRRILTRRMMSGEREKEE